MAVDLRKIIDQEKESRLHHGGAHSDRSSGFLRTKIKDAKQTSLARDDQKTVPSALDLLVREKKSQLTASEEHENQPTQLEQEVDQHTNKVAEKRVVVQIATANTAEQTVDRPDKRQPASSVSNKEHSVVVVPSKEKSSTHSGESGKIEPLTVAEHFEEPAPDNLLFKLGVANKLLVAGLIGAVVYALLPDRAPMEPMLDKPALISINKSGSMDAAQDIALSSDPMTEESPLTMLDTVVVDESHESRVKPEQSELKQSEQVKPENLALQVEVEPSEESVTENQTTSIVEQSVVPLSIDTAPAFADADSSGQEQIASNIESDSNTSLVVEMESVSETLSDPITVGQQEQISGREPVVSPVPDGTEELAVEVRAAPQPEVDSVVPLEADEQSKQNEITVAENAVAAHLPENDEVLESLQSTNSAELVNEKVLDAALDQAAPVTADDIQAELVDANTVNVEVVTLSEQDEINQTALEHVELLSMEEQPEVPSASVRVDSNELPPSAEPVDISKLQEKLVVEKSLTMEPSMVEGQLESFSNRIGDTENLQVPVTEIAVDAVQAETESTYLSDAGELPEEPSSLPVVEATTGDQATEVTTDGLQDQFVDSEAALVEEVAMSELNRFEQSVKEPVDLTSTEEKLETSTTSERTESAPIVDTVSISTQEAVVPENAVAVSGNADEVSVRPPSTSAVDTESVQEAVTEIASIPESEKVEVEEAYPSTIKLEEQVELIADYKNQELKAPEQKGSSSEPVRPAVQLLAVARVSWCETCSASALILADGKRQAIRNGEWFQGYRVTVMGRSITLRRGDLKYKYFPEL